MVLFLSSLIGIILIIPTLIVIPYVNDDEQEAFAVEQEEEKVQTKTARSSLFSVEVMRTNVDEVEDVPLEQYVLGVVASEMPSEFEVEALKAQGLAARTYIINHLLYQGDQEEYDVTDGTEHQVYQSEEELRKLWGSDYGDNMKKLTEAVASTEGEILTYEDTPITPAFFSTSNGYTENSEDYWENELPYLRSVESPWDEESPKFMDQKVFTVSEVEAALGVELQSDQAIPIEVTRTGSKRVSEMKLADHQFSGRETRDKLNLQSSDFEVEQNQDHMIFTTKGFGHGIGMSQYGANGMAKEGKDYEDIVNYYYKDIEISTIAETAPTLVAK
ncbi:MAG TPA: stage II sporulation protein D [Virgibacillus sp.]|nr:stage II sporulation protein D [Virgibacillus sp.]